MKYVNKGEEIRYFILFIYFLFLTYGVRGQSVESSFNLQVCTFYTNDWVLIKASLKSIENMLDNAG